MVGERVAGRGDRLDLRVAEPDDLAVGERVVVELDACALGEIRGRSGAVHQFGESGDVVGLHVGLDDGGDLRPLALRERDVLVDQVDVGIDDGELADGLAAEQVGGARGVVVEQLTEEHDLTSYQVID